MSQQSAQMICGVHLVDILYLEFGSEGLIPGPAG